LINNPLSSGSRAGALLLGLMAPFVFATAHSVAAQDTHVLLIGGLGGDEQHRQQFLEWGGTFVDAATEKLGVPRDHIVYLGEKPDADPRIAERSSRDNVERTFAEIAAKAAPGDHVFIMLIGHGSYASGESRFNLPGPDLTAEDFALMLDQLSDQDVSFANVTSASGGFVAALSGPRRTIVTATKTGMERNESVFAGYFVDAFAGGGADLDKNGRISMSEAFEFATTEVAREYEADGRIQTEHALLDDNGDSEGSASLEEGLDGTLASRLFLGASPTAVAAMSTDDPALRALYEKKGTLEQQVEELAALKDQMDEDRYEAELEDLLVELALTNREIQGLEGGES
jgi:hypothetical protein